MTASVADLATSHRGPWGAPGLTPVARSLLRRKLRGIAHGRLTLRDAGVADPAILETGDPRSALRATVTVHDPRFYPAIAFGGSVGAGEAYMDGWWSTDDLVAVVRILLQNRRQLDGLDGGSSRLTAPLRHLFHRLRPSSRRGSRRNAAAHYDLSNELFGLFLDPSLTYSCAVWERGDETLEQAQTAKIDRLCRKLRLRPADHLLEIGTGWGALAVHAATRYGCRVTTTTLSAAQREVAARRIAAAGVGDRVRLLALDYRDLEGRFDKLVSVEMIEVVGHRRMPAFFAACSRLLRPDGLAALQAITIADRHYAAARHSVDFIQRYVFPGGAIPSVGSLAKAAATTDLTVVDLEDLGPFYARTIACWRARLAARRDDVLRLGFDERLRRLFEFYFAYCEGGFLERAISDIQLVLAKPQARPEPLVRNGGAR